MPINIYQQDKPGNTQGQQTKKNVEVADFNESVGTTESGQGEELVLIDESPNKQLKAPNVEDYRADIDGLRTLAVIPVLVFHAWPDLFPGGFIGVDIFFVISGYLISRIIFKKHQKNSFSYADFYIRRVRRIFPCLLMMLVTVIVLSFRYLQPTELKSVMTTMFAGSLFGANIQILTLEGGYFDIPIKMNPLLHLWSLGVEEQYYIFWPCIAALVLRKFTGSKSMWFMAAMALFFFVLNVVLVYTTNPKYAFYLPFTRFWQMLVGSMLAYASLYMPTTLKRLWLEVLLYIGLALLAVGFAITKETSPFPGLFALLPTLGAALIIFAGPQVSFNKYVLSSLPFVFVGKISYPLYLWHWPLLVFSRFLYRQPGVALLSQPGSMLLISQILSIFSYYFVQQSVRHNTRKSVCITLAVLMVCVTVSSAITMFNPYVLSPNEFKKFVVPDLPFPVPSKFITPEGHINSAYAPKQKDATVHKLMNAFGDFEFPPKEFIAQEGEDQGFVFNKQGKEKIVVMGDSHALALSHRFIRLAQIYGKENFPAVYYFAGHGQAFIQCKYRFDPYPNRIKRVLEMKPKNVLIVTFFELYLAYQGKPEDPLHDPILCCEAFGRCPHQSPADVAQLMKLFKANIKQIRDAGINVFYTGITPQGVEFNPGIMYDFMGPLQNNLRPSNQSTYAQKYNYITIELKKTAQETGATLLDISKNFCWDNRCSVVDPFGNPIVTDMDHFRPEFARNYIDVIDVVIPGLKQ